MGRVAQSVLCLAAGWTTERSRFDHRQRWKEFSSSLCVQTGSEAHPASFAKGTGGPFGSNNNNNNNNNDFNNSL
jgi:hypothetical protein